MRAPCVRALPSLDKLSRDYPDREVVVVAVNTEPEDEAGVRQFVARGNYDFTVVLDTGVASGRYRVDTLPSTFVVDAEGVLRALGRWTSPTSLSQGLSRVPASTSQVEDSTIPKATSWRSASGSSIIVPS